MRKKRSDPHFRPVCLCRYRGFAPHFGMTIGTLIAILILYTILRTQLIVLAGLVYAAVAG